MIILALTLILLWLATMILLAMPVGTLSSTWDRICQGRFRNDRASLQIMLDHLRSFPDQWTISTKSASFPKEGAKQIFLEFDDRKGWTYNLSAFDNSFRPLNGHFGSQFSKQLAVENNNREKTAILRNFYPELSGQVLLK